MRASTWLYDGDGSIKRASSEDDQFPPRAPQHPLLQKDALAQLGGGETVPVVEDDQSSHGGSQSGDEGLATGPAVATQDTDLRRGQRFKKVSRALTTEAALRGVKMFKYKAYGERATGSTEGCGVCKRVRFIPQTFPRVTPAESRFFLHAGAIAFVCITSIASFMAMFMLLNAQTTDVASLQTIGKVAVSVGQIYIAALGLDILFNNLVRR